ncbi:MAG: OstA-like protein [Cyclobacteriaceae bacterium]
MLKIRSYTIFILAALPLLTVGQKNERIQYKADDLYEFRENGQKIRKLIGNVIFKQKTTTMYCDSSLYYVRTNTMEAFGRVKIVDDSVTITSNRLIYDGGDRTAKLRGNVVYTKGERQMFTDFLDYNMDTEVGNYFNGGRLKDSTNVLTSKIGYYYAKEDYALFWNKVSLTAPDYTLNSDTLRYNTTTKVAVTPGNTEIVNEDGSRLYAKGGEFRTLNDQSEFKDGNIETEDYILAGDEMFFDDLNRYYKAEGNVVLTAKNDNIVIIGNEGYTDKEKNLSKVYGQALMKRVLQNDTLYLAADTLVSIESEYDSLERILAYPNVKMWRFDIQGVADSAAYFLSDSMIFMYKDPVIWSKKNQIEGDTIQVEISEEDIKTMTLLQNSFLSSEDTLFNYNQVKGRTMKAYFEESRIQRIDVSGNGEAIYYVLDEKDSTNIELMGMNRILCSDLTIRFKNQELNNISFYKKPEARFIPPHELNQDVQRLKGFQWRIAERPTLEIVLYKESPIPKGESEEQTTPSLPPPVKLKMEGLPEGKGTMLKKSKRKQD